MRALLRAPISVKWNDGEFQHQFLHLRDVGKTMCSIKAAEERGL